MTTFSPFANIAIEHGKESLLMNENKRTNRSRSFLNDSHSPLACRQESRLSPEKRAILQKIIQERKEALDALAKYE